MTLDEITNTYQTRDGVIVSPGKFEGEPVYVPYFWDAFPPDWVEDEDDDGVLIFKVSAEDRAAFPGMLDGVREVRLREDDNGFVHSQVIKDAA